MSQRRTNSKECVGAVSDARENKVRRGFTSEVNVSKL